MKKLIILLLSILIISCDARSYVSDSDAIVLSVERNTYDKNPWNYIVHGVYINNSINLMNIRALEDPRSTVKSFYLYTNKKYYVGDTIRLTQ